MKGIKIAGIKINGIYVKDDVKSMQQAVDGKVETIKLRDGGLMLCDREALPKDKPYNNLASLVAGTSVYGDAVIIGHNGKDFMDVPDEFLVLFNFPDDYFK